MKVFPVLIVLLLLGGCSPTIIEPPAEIPRAIDKPSFSEEEAAAYVWSLLPEQLPNGYQKSQFLMNTKSAIYKGNGKWLFEVFGSGEDMVPLPSRTYKKSGTGGWVEEQREEVTTYELRLIADFYEKIRILEILKIEKSNIEVKTKVSEISIPDPERKELLVQWFNAQYAGMDYYVEGSVKNVGAVPLEDVEVEISDYDSDHNLIITQRITIYPQIIGVGELGHFKFKYQERIDLRFYTYRFVLPSGEEIPFRLETQD